VVNPQGRLSNQISDGGGALATAGVVITRVLVPLWLLVGAVLKFVDDSPANLAAVLVKFLGDTGVDLLFVLRFNVGVELVVVGVIWLLPMLARPLALVMLGAFFPILLGDVLLGASSCGCFGSVQVHPAITMVVDGAFFLGVLLLGRRAPSLAVTATLPTLRTVIAGLWVLVSFAIAFGGPKFVGSSARSDVVASNSAIGGAPALPADGYFMPDYASWHGTTWKDTGLAHFVLGMPEDIETGEQYILFFRKDCEHCHELMEIYFSGSLAIPTTAVAVPERSGYPASGVFDFPCAECRMAELPAGIDWFLQTPVLVRLENGIVQCAAEVEAANPDCVAH